MADLTIVIKGDAKSARKAIGQINTQLKGSDKSTKSLSSSNRGLKVAMAAAGVAATAVLAKGLKDALNQAADFEEANAKFGQVFRNNSREANAMRKELVDAYGVSTLEATKMLSGIQDLLVPMGFARKEATKMSGDMARLARDLASFNDQPTEEVLRAMQSGLQGMAIPMRQFGVDLTETSLKQFALSQGITKSVEKMTQQEKIGLRMKKMFNDSSDAVGDYKRTSDSWTNTIRNMTSQGKDFMLVVGQQLQGELKDTLTQLGKFLKTEEGMKLIANTAKGIATAFIILKADIMAIVDVLRLFKEVSSFTLKSFFRSAKENEEQLEKVIDAGSRLKSNFTENLNSIKETWDKHNKVVIKGTDDITKGVDKGTGAIEDQRSALEKLKESNENFYKFVIKASDTFVNSIVSSFDDMKVTSKEVFASIAQAFTDLFAGEIAALAAKELAKGIALLLTLNPKGALHIAAAGGLTSAAVGIKAAGNAVVAQIMKAQEGADFVVPGGFPNDSFIQPMALTSGERVTVTPEGETSGIYIENMTVVANNPEEFGNQLQEFALETGSSIVRR